MVEVEGDQVILSTYPETAGLSTTNIVEGDERMWSSSTCVDNSTQYSEDVFLVSCTQFTQRCCLPQYSVGSPTWTRRTYVSVSPDFRTQMMLVGLEHVYICKITRIDKQYVNVSSGWQRFAFVKATNELSWH